MKPCKNMYPKLCSYKNLELAFEKAKKNKGKLIYIVKFGEDLNKNLLKLQEELLTQSYQPRPLKKFIVRDLKTRTIHASAFRDRVVHHTLCNILEPLFDKAFIYDSYASRKGKGTLKAVQRFDRWKRKASKNGILVNNNYTNNNVVGYALKADVKHYFQTVDHEILLNIIKRRVQDRRLLWLIQQILKNYHGESPGKGMPLGNLTSQFFANVYLNELDRFVKHKLKAKYYLRYVDDFIILHSSKEQLISWKESINDFLKKELQVALHTEKSKIIPLRKGTTFLGYRIFYYHKLLKKSNLRKFERKFKEQLSMLENGGGRGGFGKNISEFAWMVWLCPVGKHSQYETTHFR